MKRPIQTNNGMSMIELMIIVAIVGILAAVAIPAFFDVKQPKPTTFVRETKQDETVKPVVLCVEGVKYLSVRGGVTAMVDQYGRPITCEVNGQ